MVGSAGTSLALRASTAKAAPTVPKAARADLSEEYPERPLVAIDWHNTVSFDNPLSGRPYIPAANIDALCKVQRAGYDLVVASFASKQETQQKVLRGAQELQTNLVRNFTEIAIVPVKSLEDNQHDRPSITGHGGCKASFIRDCGACIFIDDQLKLIHEAQRLQEHRAVGNRVVAIKAFREPATSLVPLVQEIERGRQLDQRPVPSFLMSLC